jgi:hypothetical protein
MKTVVRFLAVLLLMAFVAAIGNALHPVTEGWIPAMKQNVFASQTVPSKPLIDTQLSKQVATATFAMG